MSDAQTPCLIKGWAELAKFAESSPTHYLMINQENGNGWIKKRDSKELGTYLTTHTFYGSQFERMTRKLQECGFNVRLENWDTPHHHD